MKFVRSGSFCELGFVTIDRLHLELYWVFSIKTIRQLQAIQ